MRTLKTREAATFLGVTPNTLRTWERRFGCPRSARSSGGHRSYVHAEVVALHEALKRGLSVESAVSAVREDNGADAEALVTSLDSHDGVEADNAMDASLALRSLERTIEEFLLPALDEIRRRHGPTSYSWAFAQRWGLEWLARTTRIVATLDDAPAVLVGDASGGDLSASRPTVRALELLCRRAGLNVVVSPIVSVTGLGDAIAVLEPTCVIVAGTMATPEQVSRWVAETKREAGSLPVVSFLRTGEASERGTISLNSSPAEAQRQLSTLVRQLVAKRAHSRGETIESAQFG